MIGLIETGEPTELRKIFLVDLALLFCSILLGLAVLEFAVRFFAPQSMNGSMYEDAPHGYAVNKSSGSAFFSSGEYNGTYYFTSPHLRGVNPAPKSAERILVLGDSFSFGWNLPEKDTYVGRLQAQLDSAYGVGKIALLNAGIGGSGTAEQLAFLEDFGDEIAPAAVLDFTSIDDFARAQRSSLYRLQSRDSFDLVSGMQSHNSLKDTVKNSMLYNIIIEHLQLAQFLKRSYDVIYLKYTAVAPDMLHPNSPYRFTEVTDDQKRLAQALFRRMKVWCDTHAAKLTVVNNGWRRYDWLPEMLKEENISTYDAEPQLRSMLSTEINQLIIPNNGHPNAKGAALIADAVWPFLRNFISENLPVASAAQPASRDARERK